MYKLQAALQMYVESCLAHQDDIVGIKEGAIKGDVFHLISGVWRSPAERCFLCLGGFSPSKVIKDLCYLFGQQGWCSSKGYDSVSSLNILRPWMV